MQQLYYTRVCRIMAKGKKREDLHHRFSLLLERKIPIGIVLYKSFENYIACTYYVYMCIYDENLGPQFS